MNLKSFFFEHISAKYNIHITPIRTQLVALYYYCYRGRDSVRARLMFAQVHARVSIRILYYNYARQKSPSGKYYRFSTYSAIQYV